MKEIFDKLKHSPIHNYVLPGLTSWMLKASSENSGSVRMFESSRETQEFITPHSHRYGLHCEVLEGWVKNTIWTPVAHHGAARQADEWMLCSLKYGGEPGRYDLEHLRSVRFSGSTSTYSKGENYSMRNSEIHSIQFSRDAVVVITETSCMTDTTQILLPMAYGKVVPTFQVQPWMYNK